MQNLSSLTRNPTCAPCILPLHWERGVLTTGLLGKSLTTSFQTAALTPPLLLARPVLSHGIVLRSIYHPWICSVIALVYRRSLLSGLLAPSICFVSTLALGRE